jgi:pseudaminic acid synthase
MNIIEVKNTEEDAKIIFDWRNDETTRLMSFNTDLKIWKNFIEEFKNNYFSNILPPLFALYNNEKIALIGFVDDNLNKEHIINININPNYRNKGFGKEILLKSLDYIRLNYKNHHNNIIAHIKEKNIPSNKIFQKCNFILRKNYIKNSEVIYEYIYKMDCFNIGKCTISKDHPTFIIAELSCNHNQNYDSAIKLIHEAHKAGANAIKLQSYTPDTITLNCKKNYFKIKGTIWEDQYLYDLYKTAYTPWDWHKGLKEEANKLGMELFSSPFDPTAVDLLESLDVPAYKIASFEITDHILIKKIAQTGKPVIISSGMASKEELREAVELLRKYGTKHICMLKCTSAYPAEPEDANLLTMKDMEESFNIIPGLSDHTLGIEVPIVSVVLGAKVIEKHFTLSRDSGSADDAFSLTPDEFKQMVEGVRKAEKTIGKITYGGVKSEEECKKFRRSLFVCKDIKEDDEFTTENVRSIRPGMGLHTKYYDEILGKKAKFNIEFGEPLNFDMIK